jgi:hypothetical protein
MSLTDPTAFELPSMDGRSSVGPVLAGGTAPSALAIACDALSATAAEYLDPGPFLVLHYFKTIAEHTFREGLGEASAVLEWAERLLTDVLSGGGGGGGVGGSTGVRAATPTHHHPASAGAATAAVGGLRACLDIAGTGGWAGEFARVRASLALTLLDACGQVSLHWVALLWDHDSEEEEHHADRGKGSWHSMACSFEM